MLLVLTGSADGTADLLFSRIGKRAFRFNYDIFSDYSVAFQPDRWSIESPTGFRIDSTTATAAFWWKAFNYFVDEEDYIAEEVKYIFREIYGWFWARNRLRGTPPEFHRYKGKLNLLQTAKAHFVVPETVCGWGGVIKSTKIPKNNVVAKSLTSGLTTTNKALFTTEVQTSKLDTRYPWFLQRRIDAKSDVTIFVCGNKLFSFERDRSDLEGLDWRNQDDLFSCEQKWKPFTLSEQQKKGVAAFLSAIGVDWGRLDFMWTGVELIFLEYNANGQFVFLDQKNQFGLLDAVEQYLLKYEISRPSPLEPVLRRPAQKPNRQSAPIDWSGQITQGVRAAARLSPDTIDRRSRS
jgi:hypothetical protein